MKPPLMKIQLPKEKHREIRRIADSFFEAGFECYLVGGSVRDIILGFDVDDFDFATNARPEQVRRLFRKVIPTGIKHGTVSVLSGGRAYEITTYRSDGKYMDGRRPEEVSFSETLEEDVRRRDFTINGIACDVRTEEIIDHVGGLADIERRLIRTIGDPMERFGEDGLRTFRACRFAAKLNFEIEEETFAAISKTLEVASMVSMERVRDELVKLLEADVPSIGFERMRESGLMGLFLPELAASHGLTQNKYHLYDIYYHSVYSCDAAPKNDPVLRLASLLHDLGKVPTRRPAEDGEYTFYNHEVIGARIARRVMKRLKFSNEEIERVTNLVLNHMFHYTDEWTDGAVRRFMRKVGVENLKDILEIRMADRRGNGMRDGVPQPIRELLKRIDRVIEAENAITVRDLDIDGYVLMDELGMKPGPIIGHVLNELLEMVLDSPEMNTRETLLARARGIYETAKDDERFRRRD
ncbi:MAG: CCA tRNA nucleotidyltransferase [Spirochaetota bacterium]